MIGSSENTIKEITKKITVGQIINRKKRRLQPNQKDFKKNNSSHMTLIYIYINENGKETYTKTKITYKLKGMFSFDITDFIKI